jgi:CysZ protein
MIAAALASIEQIFTRPFRSVFWKSIGLTLLLLVALWAGIEKLVVTYVHLSYGWLATTIHVLAGLGLVVGITFLIPGVSFLVGSFFFDDLADHVESTIAGPDGRGRAMAIAPALWIGVKFGLVSLLVNALALLFLLVPGVNAVAFFGANAYLLGRGFFELAALRYLPLDEVRALRQRHGIRLILAGGIIAAVLAVPILNLLTPLFATAFMVRVARPLILPALSARGRVGTVVTPSLS